MAIRMILTLFIALFLLQNNIYPEDFDLIGKVESVRKDNFVTLLFDKKPDKDNYLIIEENTVTGKVTLIEVNLFARDEKFIYRAKAEYSLEGNRDKITAGTIIGLLKGIEKKEAPLEEKGKKDETIIYKQYKFTETDYRETILIPAGKFLLGSEKGDSDEKPQQIIYLDDFYIDKYEVSNSDYNIFIKRTNSKPPLSWSFGKYSEKEDDYPVMVSYYEAVKYAEWAGKRLPTEEEWEKAARGTGIELVKRLDESLMTIEKQVIYPWGNIFDPSKANSAEFWDNKNTGNDIKKKYTKGLLPVYIFREAGESVYGIVNMAGNAPEWTSSWYKAYNGNKYANKMFGTQVKVIRGGGWFNSKYNLRTTDREIGGLPNLYEDNIAGFRCVKDPSIIDRK